MAVVCWGGGLYYAGDGGGWLEAVSFRSDKPALPHTPDCLSDLEQ